MTTSCGCPVSARDMSCSGPLGPIFHGVWQSWQPMVRTRYAPRSMRATLVEAPVGSDAAEEMARATAPESVTAMRAKRMVVR